MARNFVSKSIGAGAIALTALTVSASPARACGGFFCSQSQPVNQAAERIIFAQNGDGTVTAVIQILYEGPSENFSWLLPIASVPQGDDIAVASDLAFARLQQATNPSYNLTTRIEGECLATQSPPFGGSAGGSALPSRKLSAGTRAAKASAGSRRAVAGRSHPSPWWNSRSCAT